jgi:nucleoside-diphosphate-sugar epimerase
LKLNQEKIFISGSEGYIGKSIKDNLSLIDKLRVKNISKNNFTSINSKDTINSTLIYLSQPSSVNYKYNEKDILFLKNILKKKWKHIIYFSSCLVNNFKYVRNKNNIPDYIKLKIISEKIITKKNSTILRLSNVYGEKFKKNTFLYKLKSIKKKEHILKLVDENHLRDFIHLVDINKCIERIIEVKPNGVFNLGSGKSISTNDIISLMSNNNKYIQKNLKLMNFKKKIDTKIKLDITKIKIVLNWKPTIFIHNFLIK